MGELIEGRDIGIELALPLVQAAHAAARDMSLGMCAVVVDRGGNVVASGRMDDAPIGALSIATDKAYTSAMWKCRTGELGEATLPGGGDWGFPLTMGGRLIVFAGGVPIRRDGELIGALGVSGALSEEDEACALAALAALGLEG